MSTWLTEERLEKWMQTLWGLVLLTMPVTSFRWLPNVMGNHASPPAGFLPAGSSRFGVGRLSVED